MAYHVIHNMEDEKDGIATFSLNPLLNTNVTEDMILLVHEHVNA